MLSILIRHYNHFDPNWAVLTRVNGSVLPSGKIELSFVKDSSTILELDFTAAF